MSDDDGVSEIVKAWAFQGAAIEMTEAEAAWFAAYAATRVRKKSRVQHLAATLRFRRMGGASPAPFDPVCIEAADLLENQEERIRLLLAIRKSDNLLVEFVVPHYFASLFACQYPDEHGGFGATVTFRNMEDGGVLEREVVGDVHFEEDDEKHGVWRIVVIMSDGLDTVIVRPVEDVERIVIS